MTTQQPVWKLLKNLGDVNPLEHGGYFVYLDETGVYPPEAEYYQPNEGEDTGGTVHRVILERCTFIGGILSDNKYHPESEAWFAEFATKEGLVSQLTSDDPIKLALAYQEIYQYHGWENGDDYPLEFTQVEASERYKA